MNKIQDIVILGSNQKPISIDITLRNTGVPKPVIIFCHGFKGFKDWGHFNAIAEWFANQGYVFIKFNFSHNGVSLDHPVDFVDLEAFGRNTFSYEVADTGAVIDWLFNRNIGISIGEVDLQSIALVGHSRGGGIATLRASQDKRIKKLVTWAGINEIGRFWTGDAMKEWKKNGVQYIKNGRTGQNMPMYWDIYEDFYANKTKLDIPAAVQELSIPHLIVHGTKDVAVPYTFGVEMSQWNEFSELCTIEEAGHTFGGLHPWSGDQLPDHTVQICEKTKQFLSQ